LHWLTDHASHHDGSVACHVSAIQKDAHLACCSLPEYHDRMRGDYCNRDEPYHRG